MHSSKKNSFPSLETNTKTSGVSGSLSLYYCMLDYAMRQAIDGRQEELGFTLKNRRSRRVKPEMTTDLDFVDDIALLSDQIKQVQELMNRVKKECQNVGLGINAKTKLMAYNIEEELELKLLDGTKMKEVNDFKYLGSWVDSTEEDIRIRKGLAWATVNNEENKEIKYIKEPQLWNQYSCMDRKLGHL